MKSIFVPNESFESRSEIKCINNYLYKNSELLLKEIDDRTEIWIIGNKDKDFFNKQTEQAFLENKVLDPIDGLPISKHRNIHHIAVINHKYDNNDNLNLETIYANSDFDVVDFINIVINLLRQKYPKNKMQSTENTQDYALAG
ncbi:MAG: hypothetical protein GTN99_10710 [Candidatus Dadabacteria bacterium]|nr:hypothetical protein [Candidatus Dadabacteria bacterium]NIT14684.1 hypothetical protein [Candidatus Dadabacteria bacterium]